MKPLVLLLKALLFWPIRLIARLLGALEWIGRAVLGAIALGVGFAAVVALLFAWHAAPPAAPTLPSRFVLALTLDAPLTETPPLSAPLPLWDEPQPIHLGALLTTLDHAAKDPRVAAVALDLRDFPGASYAQLAELRESLARLRQASKPLFAFADRYDQKSYFLASVADTVTLDPEGFVLLPGLALEPTYFKAALDRIGITVHAFRAGRYKSFVEPFTRTSMSESEKSAATDLMLGLWGQIRDAIAAARKRPATAIERYHTAFDEILAAHEGDAAAAAHAQGLVDALTPFGEWQTKLLESVALTDRDRDVLPWQRYHAALEAKHLLPNRTGEIRVITLEGVITETDDGNDATASSEQLVDELEAARDDDAVRAVVLRIHSPGGSAFAAEQIRRAAQAVRDAGKPVIASFAGVAASGGYWVASTADAIVARPETLTGSIGVFALIPNAAPLMEKLELTTDGVRTGPFAAPLDPRRPLPDAVRRALDASVGHTYRRFLAVVGEGRGIPQAELEPVAEGRVWLGAAAAKLGLVDRLGGLETAIALARERANAPDAVVRWPTPPLSPREVVRRLIFGSETFALAPPLASLTASLRPLAPLLRPLTAPGATLPPVWAHCLCAAP
ncbi:signal peptide peptidase SppA [Hydrogenophilus thiooxidans]|uniref:signal peptide peptidase SppA n=1 Tax=Hydrogenophilus thiooxidans TaxID=2820326 RepID=UPI001C230233|nr:signal peptide peptidase SppA [Hydrogenophilus thiooxidans]